MASRGLYRGRSVGQPSARVTRCRTRRGGGTGSPSRPSRCDHVAPGRATGTCPRARRARVRRRNTRRCRHMSAAHGDAGGHRESLGRLPRIRIDAGGARSARPSWCRARARRSPRRRQRRSDPIRPAQNSAFLRVDLVDLAGAVPVQPRVFRRPSQARIVTLRGHRNGGNDLNRAWVDLLDPVVDGRSQHDDGGASIGASAMPRGVASMRASGVERVGAIAAYSQRRTEAL